MAVPFLDIEALHELPGRSGLGVTRVMPSMRSASFFTSSMDFTTLTPPPLPRPPAWICAFTTQTGPGCDCATFTASSTLKAGAPLPVGTPNWRRISLPDIRECSSGILFPAHSVSCREALRKQCLEDLLQFRRKRLRRIHEAMDGRDRDFVKPALSSSVRATSTMRSTPFSPITTGTPTYVSFTPYWPSR